MHHRPLQTESNVSIASFRRAKRLVLIGWMLVTAAALVLTLWQAVAVSKRAFEHAAAEVSSAIIDRALVAETALEGFSAFVASQAPFDHRAAADFARVLLARYPFLYKFEVAQQIDHAERAALEQRLSGIYPGFEVKQFDYRDTRQWRVAPAAHSYFPIIFQEPYFRDERQVVGLDLNSSRFLIDAMEASFSQGLAMATRPFMLAENVTGYVIHRALDRSPGDVVGAPLTAKRYGLLALRADRLFGDVVEEYPELAISLSHCDDSRAAAQPAPLMETQGKSSTGIERFVLPRFQRAVSLEKTVPSQPFELNMGWQMTWRDLNLPILIGLILFAALAPLFARRLALAYFEDRLAGLDSGGELYRMANFDALTGVANRHRLIEQLEITLLRAERDKTQFCLLMMDIDGFKGVNDRLGHAAGDAVLVAFCERLDALIRGDEMLGRLGGDEFVLLTSDSLDPINATSLIVRVKQQAREPVIYRKQMVPIDISVGHACYPSDGRNVTALLEIADQRMYSDKRRHGDRSVTPG
jgi:diguanylate cyclase (GGDEF)-like protein